MATIEIGSRMVFRIGWFCGGGKFELCLIPGIEVRRDDRHTSVAFRFLFFGAGLCIVNKGSRYVRPCVYDYRRN